MRVAQWSLIGVDVMSINVAPAPFTSGLSVTFTDVPVNRCLSVFRGRSDVRASSVGRDKLR